jgi:hypothetical protein
MEELQIEKKIPEDTVCELDFDPDLTGHIIHRVFQDRIARNLWLGIKWKHIVDQHFNENCLKVADWIREGKLTMDDGAMLNHCLTNAGMIGVNERDMGFLLIPFTVGSRDFRYEVCNDGRATE